MVTQKRQSGLLPVVLLFGITLLSGRLTQSLWSDEAGSVWFARLPPETLLFANCDPHPAGYYLLLKSWLWGGAPEFWLRWPSLVAAVVAVALTCRLGREGFTPRTAWLAALLLALYPLQSWYATEARMYILVQCLGLLLVWQGLRLLDAKQPPRRRDAAIYAVIVVLALGVDYLALIPFWGLQLVWLARGRPHPRFWVGIQAAALAVAGLLWLTESQRAAFGRSYQPVFVAVQANRFGLELTPAGAAWLIFVAMAGFVLLSLWAAWAWSFYPNLRLNASAVHLFWMGGWLFLLLLAALPRGFTVKRQLMVLLPWPALFAGHALARLPRPVGEWVATLGLLITVFILPGHPREPWRAVVAELARPVSNQKTVIWVDELSVPAFDYYARQHAKERRLRWTPLIGRHLPQLPPEAPARGDDLWVVTAQSIYRRLIPLLPPEFQQQYQLLETRRETGIGLYRYRRRVNPEAGEPVVPEVDDVARWGLLLPSPLDTCR